MKDETAGLSSGAPKALHWSKIEAVTAFVESYYILFMGSSPN